jgi:hypothetical protein
VSAEGPHHALAMRQTTAATVLGDFSGAWPEHFRVRDDLFHDGDKFMVRTEGPEGALHEYPTHYTFGIYPLQQYLIALTGRRLAASHLFAGFSATVEFH